MDRRYGDKKRVVEILLGGNEGNREEENCQATSLCHLNLEKKNKHEGKKVVGVGVLQEQDACLLVGIESCRIDNIISICLIFFKPSGKVLLFVLEQDIKVVGKSI